MIDLFDAGACQSGVDQSIDREAVYGCQGKSEAEAGARSIIHFLSDQHAAHRKKNARTTTAQRRNAWATRLGFASSSQVLCSFRACEMPASSPSNQPTNQWARVMCICVFDLAGGAGLGVGSTGGRRGDSRREGRPPLFPPSAPAPDPPPYPGSLSLVSLFSVKQQIILSTVLIRGPRRLQTLVTQPHVRPPADSSIQFQTCKSSLCLSSHASCRRPPPPPPTPREKRRGNSTQG